MSPCLKRRALAASPSVAELFSTLSAWKGALIAPLRCWSHSRHPAEAAVEALNSTPQASRREDEAAQPFAIGRQAQEDPGSFLGACQDHQGCVPLAEC